ncbi:MAG: acetyl-CoA decarbonylase/synthase complex subunit alpha/beta [Candidatus Omnitrophica bacterium]|nr:acetyl-CoA decarbonylase/synthase complex subunit alpha/beta [Candidatus Omnitrophota bacterium]
MSLDVIINLGKKGLEKLLAVTQQEIEKNIEKYGKRKEISFPETNYYFPLAYALLNIEVKTLDDLLTVFEEVKKLDKNQPAKNGLFISYLDGLFNKGMATLLCEEIIAGIKTLNKEHPQDGFLGFIPDRILRSLGVQLVDGRIAGVSVILGTTPNKDIAENIIRGFQTRSIVSLLVGNIEGKTFKKQLEEKKVELGLEEYIVSLGEDYLSAIYAVNFAIRAPLIYGGIKPGDWKQIMEYIKNRVPAFVLLLGHIDEILVATGLGVIALGIPIITNLDVPQIGKLETTLHEALVTERDYKKIVESCILTRGIKVKTIAINIPIAYAPAFEGERVRKENLYVEFGGRKSLSFEYLVSRKLNEIEDGKIEIFGSDIDSLKDKIMPLAIIVEVSGRKMEKDFEPILERQIHRFINYAQGIMHIGQRDMNWIRISREAFDKGFRLKHIGVILHAMFHREYGAIVDKLQVKIYTELKKIENLLIGAKKTYEERDARIGEMTDENVDTFYSCTLCQSFAPNHVCIITPQRLGLCGAYSWLDAKASYEIMPSGPNQPILKGEVIDSKLGQWENVNEFIHQKSNRTVEKVSMYSLMDSPQTSCGCFECIVAVLPETNGVMIVNRDYTGMTPCGMTFTTLAGSVGGGVQTPGFLGVGKLYMVSKKFISAEGGFLRIVWMPKELKEELREKLEKRAKEENTPDFLDKIADETVATSMEELLPFLEKVKHPALKMPALI